MTIHSNISEIDTEQWQQLVDNSLVASFFQTRECYEFYASLSFLKPFVFAISENEKLVGLICGYIIADGRKVRRLFSCRAIVPGGMLLDKTISEKALQSLLNFTIKTLKNQLIYIELRNYNDYSQFKEKIKPTGFQYQQHFDIHLHINDETEQKISESKRREIKTAQKNGVQYFETKEATEIEAFYTILQNLYKKDIKLPLFPLEFFLKLSQLPQGKIFVIKQNDIVIGGIACVTFAKKILYEWFACGNKNVGKQLYPSVMATYAGIDYATKNSFVTYDFMGAGKPGKDYGVREFKTKFGGELLEYGRFLYVAKPLLYNFGKIALKIKKRT
jgi:lipid II:glycine glycyltransferase (peptidoglycan interpeptide bridge formation enzyme)